MPTSREDSKKEYIGNQTTETVNMGSLQRIADACEKMATNYQKMEADLALYKKLYYEKCETVAKLNRKISAYKGVVTKLTTAVSKENSQLSRPLY